MAMELKTNYPEFVHRGLSRGDKWKAAGITAGFLLAAGFAVYGIVSNQRYYSKIEADHQAASTGQPTLHALPGPR